MISDPDFPRLKEHLIAATGLAYYADKDQDLLERVGRRLAALSLDDCQSYLGVLEREAGGAELDRLIAELTIGETYFFRQEEQFRLLAGIVLPESIERNRASRRLRIWSAGCARCEPYSVALLLERDFGHWLAGWDVAILATDINREFLERARRGRYEEWALRALPEEIRLGCFRRAGKSWEIAPQYRARVAFQHHNLVNGPFPPPADTCVFDLILCRNVMIYFSREVARRIVTKLGNCLADRGWLLVGHAEPNAELFQAFRAVVVDGETVYQKAGETSEARVAAAPPAWSLSKPEPRPAEAEAVAPPEIAKAELDEVRRLADAGDWENAAACCRKLLAQDDLNPAAYFYYGLVLEQTGRPREAERALRRAIYLDRRFVLAHHQLGLVLERMDASGAKRSFENALELLSRMDAGARLAGGDGLTAGELAELARMRLEALGGP